MSVGSIGRGMKMYCFQCGNEVKETQKYCTSCGTDLREVNNLEHAATNVDGHDTRFQDQVKDTFLNATKKVNQMVGEQGSINVNLKDVFSDVFKKHTKEEAEHLFISGTSTTTPEEANISTSWPRPWLFSRVFFVLALTFVFLYISAIYFQNNNAIPGLNFIGSFAVPFALLIFFWEMNAPRNISFYEVVKMLFIGGAASLVTTLFLYLFFPIYDITMTSAVIIGVLEEVGKLAIIAYFVKKLNPKFILNGLLIGATIGAGFAAFESAGYANEIGLMYGEFEMISIIFLRGWMSIGTHVVWSAIAGAALVYVKGNHPLVQAHFFDANFLKLFLVPVILHAVWDMPLYVLQQFYFMYVILIVVAWVFIFTLIHAGLKQISRINESHILEKKN